MDIEIAKVISKKLITTKFNLDYSIDNVDKEAIDTVLSELEKKDRIIKEMAGHIILMNDSRGLTNEEKIKYFIDMVEREGK